MELILDVYEHGKIIKTYKAEEYFILYGTLKDCLKTFEAKELIGADFSSNDILFRIGKQLVTNGLDLIEPIIKDVFPGLTTEELRKTRIQDLAKILVRLAAFAINQITEGATEKN